MSRDLPAPERQTLGLSPLARTRSIASRVGVLAAILAAAMLVLTPLGEAWADPPDWAPAHGRRDKEHHRHHHERYDDDDGPRVYVLPPPAYVVPRGRPTYGIAESTCYRKVLGALIGAGGGAYAGHEVAGHGNRAAGAVLGGLLGALVGGAVGQAMDEVDQNCVGQVLEQAPNGRAVAWANPDNGERYVVSPVRSFQDRSGRYCREYTTKARIGGRTQQTYGTACRQPDGAWQIVN